MTDLLAEIWLVLGAVSFIGITILFILEWASGSDKE